MKTVIRLLSMGLMFIPFMVWAQQITEVNPDTIYQSQNVWLEINGSNTQFTGIQSANQVVLRRGMMNIISSDTIHAINDTFLKAHFSLGTQTPGLYELRINMGAGQFLRLRNAVTLLPDPNAPAIINVNPDTVMTGMVFGLEIEGKNTHFQNGGNLLVTLQRGMGQNYQPDSITISSQTFMKAWFYLPFSAVTGYYSLIVRNDSDGVIQRNNALFVQANPNSPRLTFISPNRAGQGDTVILEVHGENTHFNAPNGVLMMLRQGNQTQINPDSTRALSDTVFLAYYQFPVSAPLGFYTAMVLDAIDGQLNLANAIEIVQSTYSPQITAVNPSRVYRGDTVIIEIHTSNTSLTQSTSLYVSFRQGFRALPVDSVNVINDTLIKVYMRISPNAPTGMYALVIQGTPEGTLTLNDALEVLINPNEPLILYIDPDSTYQGTQLWVSFYCRNTHFLSDTNLEAVLQLGQFYQYQSDSISVINDTLLKAHFDIPMNAQTGVYSARINNLNNGSLMLPNAFTILLSPYAPRIKSFAPVYAYQGDSIILTIKGAYTHFTTWQGTVVNLRMGFGSNINAYKYDIVSDTVLLAYLIIPETAPTGFYTLLISSNSEGPFIQPQAFEVKPAPTSPQIMYVEPHSARAGDQVTLKIFCKNTQLTSENNLSVRLNMGFGNRINASSVNVVNDTLVTAIFDISQNARPGLYNVQLLNLSTGNLNLPGSFEIRPPYGIPQLTGITPAKGKRNEKLVIKIYGSGTHFSGSQNTVQFSIFNQSYTPESISIVNDSLMQCNITFPPQAYLGFYSVNVTNDIDRQMNLPQAFQLVSYTPEPGIVSIDKDTLYTGNQYEIKIISTETRFLLDDVIHIWMQSSSQKLASDSFHVIHDSLLISYWTVPAKSSTGNYDLYVFTDREDTMSLSDAVYLMDTTTSLPENYGKVLFTLYPNPFTDEIFIIPENKSIAETFYLVVFNVRGQFVSRKEIKWNSSESIKTSSWAPGEYLIYLYNRNNHLLFKGKLLKIK